ncbi:amidohydrolase family protein [Aliikangiella sp. IMCC44653]
MKRRKFLKAGFASGAAVAVSAYAGWHYYFDGEISNPCLLDELPKNLQNHKLMQQAFMGLDPKKIWDCHFHLVGNGISPSIDQQPSEIYLNPKMSQWVSPLQRIQYGFYLNASCIGQAEFADRLFLESVAKIAASSPAGVKFMLLAFDYQHDEQGRQVKQASTFYVPNQYAARTAKLLPYCEWIGSVHPYKENALEELQWCKDHGAKAIKWLPPAMNIDPSSNQCELFYKKLIELDLPLLTHAGEEKAVHSETLQQLANPLLLRLPLELGVKVIVAHCASLGSSLDIEAQTPRMVANFDLFSRLMDEAKYRKHLYADISAINLINRQVTDIKKLLKNQSWHSRLLYASDYPLPGVMPIISTKQMFKNALLNEEQALFLSSVKKHNVWLFDFLQKRFMSYENNRFSNSVFQTKDFFVPSNS